MLEADLETRCNTVEIFRQQTVGEIPRRLQRRPRHAGALVRSEQDPGALLARVDLALEVYAGQELLLPLEGGKILGDEVLVLHGEDRQLQPHHAPHFTRPQDRKSTRLNSSHSQISYAG